MTEIFIGPDGAFYQKVPNPFDRIEILLTGQTKSGEFLDQTIIATLDPQFAFLRNVDLAIYNDAEGRRESGLHLEYIDLTERTIS